MTQGRKIAFAYVFAVPAVLIVVLFERVSLLRVGTGETGMAQAAEVMRNCDVATSLLKEPAARPGAALGIAAEQPNQAALPDVVQRIRGLTANEPAIQSQLWRLDPLVAQRAALGQSIRDSAKNGWSAGRVADAETEDLKLSESMAIMVGNIRTAHQIEMEQEADAAAQSARWASAAILYGGFLTVWLIGVAAVLLFHDERRRAWKGVERRVHTRILQELPVGVCLTTGGGTILYSNSAEEAILGYEAGELFTKDVNSFVSPTEAEPAFEDLIDRLPPNQTWHGELALTKKDKSFFTVAAWVTNLEVAGKFFRVYIHNPYSRQVPRRSLKRPEG